MTERICPDCQKRSLKEGEERCPACELKRAGFWRTVLKVLGTIGGIVVAVIAIIIGRGRDRKS